VDATPKVAPESLHFMAHITEKQPDGSKSEIDTITGYRKYYYSNDKLQMEGKVTKASLKDYRDGIWNYYNEAGQLMKQETYTKEGKINELGFMYFKNGKPLSKTYQYYEGDYKDKTTFKFHKIETLFYTNGQKLSERHWMNNNLVDEKCWDSKGNSKPIEYLNTIKSVEADE
jgi:antitoxin component YwqK of YwqJK toxin-antitoxin module